MLAAPNPITAATTADAVSRIATPMWPCSCPATAISVTATPGDSVAVPSSISPVMSSLASARGDDEADSSAGECATSGRTAARAGAGPGR